MNTDFKKRVEGLKYLFDPCSVAVVGASKEITKPGGVVLAYLKEEGFKGKIYPVNPKQKEIRGLPCYPNLTAIPDKVEMAVIAVTAPQVMNILKECIAKGVKGVIIFTSGFAEAGEEGVNLQKEIKELVAQTDTRVCGPNCMGIMNLHNNMKSIFTFGSILPGNPPDLPKSAGFITQSGGFGCSTFITAINQGISFSHYISTGNEADADFADFLAYLTGDRCTKVIGGYMEGARDGKKLALAADMALEAKKPVVIYKTGRHQASARAAVSHTGALAGSDLVYTSFFRQKGIIRAESIAEMIAVMAILEAGNLPQGKRAAIFASSGGHGVVMVDKCVEAGLEIASLSEETRAGLARLLPSFANISNPIDFTGMDIVQPNLFQKCAEIVVADPGVDVVLVSYWATKELEGPIQKQLIQIANSTVKPVIAVILGSNEYVFKHIHYLHKHRVPTIMGVDSAARAVNHVAGYVSKAGSFKPVKTASPSPAKHEVEKILSSLEPGDRLSEWQTKKILAAYGIPVTREERAATADEAVTIAGQIGYPVAVKIDSPDVLHKTEADGIKLNLTTSEEVRQAFQEVMAGARRYNPQARLNGVLVQEMLKEGTEVIVGIGKDPVFGSTVIFGLGGIFVEALKDIALRVVPFDEADAWEMINEIKGRSLLEGVRGKPAADKKAIVDIILKVARLAADFPQISELDINPLMVFAEGEGACAADALLVLENENTA